MAGPTTGHVPVENGDPVQTFSSVVYRACGATSRTFQFAPPNPSFQSLITPDGNSRFPTPVRRHASGHISSNAQSSPNSSLWQTWSASERGHRSAAMFKSSMSAAISCSLLFMTSPFLREVGFPVNNGRRCVVHHKNTHCTHGGNRLLRLSF
jgi:hypothetical protein